MRKLIAIVLFALHSIIQCNAIESQKPVISIVSVGSKPALNVTISSPNVRLESATDFDEDLYDLCILHSQSYPKSMLPTKDSLQHWAQERMIRRYNLSPYHLYKIVVDGGTAGFIDFGQMPISGYSAEKYPAIVEKWQSLGVAEPELDSFGKSQATSNRGIVTVFPIFPTDDIKFDKKLQAEALALSVELMRAIGGYFSLDMSNGPKLKKLPFEWETHIIAVQKKIHGQELTPSEASLLSDLKVDSVFQNEPAQFPFHIISLLHTEDPKINAFINSKEFTLDQNKGFKKFHDKPRIMVHAPIQKKF